MTWKPPVLLLLGVVFVLTLSNANQIDQFASYAGMVTVFVLLLYVAAIVLLDRFLPETA